MPEENKTKEDNSSIKFFIYFSLAVFALIAEQVTDGHITRRNLTNYRTISGRVVQESYRDGFLGIHCSYRQRVVCNGESIPFTFHQTTFGCEKMRRLDSLVSVGDSVIATIAEHRMNPAKLYGISEVKVKRK